MASTRATRTSWAAACALAIALAALAWCGRRDDARHAPAVAPSELDSPTPAVADRVDVAGDGARTDESSRRAPTVLPDAEPPPDGGLVVRVVHARDRTGAGGADVLYVDEGAGDVFARREAERELGDPDLAALAARFGRRFRADAAGIARVPFPRASARIGASHAGAWAETWIRPETEGEITLALEPDLALDVELRGPATASRPVVALVTRAAGAQDSVRRSARADAAGRARFEHVAGFARMAREHALRLYVVADVRCAAEVAVEVDPARWPAHAVVLELPAAGRVEVELAGDGGPLAAADRDVIRRAGGTAGLTLSRDEIGRLAERGHTAALRATTTDLLDAATAFDAVGLGVELAVEVRAAGWKPTTVTFAGPRTPGETVRVRVPLAYRAASIAARIVGSEGRALSDRAIDATFQGLRVTSRRSEERRTTDADGRVAFAFGNDGEIFGQPWGAWFALADDPRLAASVELPEILPDRVVDVGDVVLTEAPLVARGRVVDDRGQPLRAVVVHLETEDQGNSTARWTAWRELPRGVARTADDGRFEFRFWTSETSLRLRTWRDGYLAAEPLAFAPPRDDLELALVRGGAIEGRFASRVLEPREWISAELLAAGESIPGGLAIGPDGAFRSSSLPAGEYTLRLRLSSSRPGTSDVAGVVVRLGETTQLGTIDLDARLRVVRLEVIDTAGQPVDGMRFALRHAGADGLHEVRVDRASDGAWQLVSFEAEHPELRVEAPGFRPSLLTGVAQDRRVTLRRGPRVRLVLRGGLPRLPAPWSLHAGPGDPSTRFDERGEARLRLSEPGRLFIRVWLRNPGELGYRGLNGLDWEIDVRDVDEEQVFESPPLSPEFLDELARNSR